LIGAGSGFGGAWLTATYRMREQEQTAKRQAIAEKLKEKSIARLRYLDPLMIAATDLRERLQTIVSDARARNEHWYHLLRHFGIIKEIPKYRAHDRPGLEYLCNGEGNRAFSTLYETAIYFRRAAKSRSELPFIELDPGDDRSLLKLLSAVRSAFHGVHGIWATLQDSIGSYVQANDRIMNYREFCGQLIENDIWFTGMSDFYNSLEPKIDYEVKNVLKALDDLIDFLETKSTVQTSI
jgi:hypothetical protein